MTLTINGQEYFFKAGMMFIREINSHVQQKTGSVTENIGLEVRLLQLLQGDPEALIDILLTANRGQSPSITGKILEEYIENECEDIEALFDQVTDFLSGSNCCKVKVAKVLERVANQNQNQ